MCVCVCARGRASVCVCARVMVDFREAAHRSVTGVQEAADMRERIEVARTKPATQKVKGM